jgi:amino acid efflux transporter
MEKQESLKATIGLPQAVALYIGAVLGSGVLIVPGLAAELAGPASLLSWGLMAVFVYPMALTMGLLAAKFPHAGGVSHFVTRAFGEKAGVLIGWFFLMSVPIGAPVAALTGAGYVTTALELSETFRIGIAVSLLAIALFVNLFGMKLAGNLQIFVVTTILGVLILAIAGSFPNIHFAFMQPFMPHGWMGVGKASTILFWCFIGWEAVSHLSEEFVDPQREAIRGVTIAASIVGILYFLTAFATVGTHAYGSHASEASLVLMIEGIFGKGGAILAGVMGAVICLATIIAYVGAASRLAYSLAKQGSAPKWLSRLSSTYNTPVGGITFLAICFFLVMTSYASGIVSLTTLIQFPNATFILTYLGGCGAGIRLLKGNRWGYRVSWLSFLLTACVLPFLGIAATYPLLVAGIGLWFIFRKHTQHPLRTKFMRFFDRT